MGYNHCTEFGNLPIHDITVVTKVLTPNTVLPVFLLDAALSCGPGEYRPPATR